MCGIAGIVGGLQAEPVGFGELERMAAMLGHRGPDGHGLYRDGRIGLAHTRLSIVDLAGGAQPLSDPDEKVWIAFNGEIFDYVELRRALEADGLRFRTASDTEVVVQAYLRYGDAVWPRLNGQFALALWDRRDATLRLVRDRFGILPLHYARSGDRLYFASEAKAIFAGTGTIPGFSAAGLAQTFAHWAATAPSSVFEGVHTLAPGTCLRIGPDLRAAETRYWRPDIGSRRGHGPLSIDAAADLLEKRLARSVALRLRADVPVGAYVSGGLDSTVIAGLARDAHGEGLETFSIRFDEPAYDETPAQRAVAGALGSRHHEILCTGRDIVEALPDVVWHCESPLLRTAPAPLFLLSRLVADTGMKVVLSGEGADELLGGYDIFKEDAIRRFWARQPDSRLRPALLARIYPDVGTADGRSSPFWQRAFAHGLGDGAEDPFHSHRIRWRAGAWRTRFLSGEVRSQAPADALEAAVARALPDGWLDWDPLARAQLIEITTFMSAHLLCYQGDRVAMANGIEVRYPYLDPDVVEFCFALPRPLKLAGLQDKRALRRLAARRWPRDIWSRPKKPYRAPIAAALFGRAGHEAWADLLTPAALRAHGALDADAAALLVAKARSGRMTSEREEMALVGILTLQILCRQIREEFRDRLARRMAMLHASAPQVRIDQAAAMPRPRYDTRTLAGDVHG